MNTFDAQGNYIDKNGKIIKRAYNRDYQKNDLSKFSESERQKVRDLLKNFDISKIFGGLKNASETSQEIETGRSSDTRNG